jgi:NAD(P)-dependent dehydrogenase (short-subunit alcohol dehydrogenase family)
MAKTVLITGGSRGIGRATAIQAGGLGWNVGVNYAGNAEAAAVTVRAVEAAGGQAIAIPGDVSVEADVIAMFDAAQAAFGPITALVNNAGIVGAKSALAEMGLERMRRIFDINVLGAYLVAREGARRMPLDRGGPGGAIVNVSSMAATLGSPGQYVDYAGSKGAVDTPWCAGQRCAARYHRDRYPRLRRRAGPGGAAGALRADGPVGHGGGSGRGDHLASVRCRLLRHRDHHRHLRRALSAAAAPSWLNRTAVAIG